MSGSRRRLLFILIVPILLLFVVHKRLDSLPIPTQLAQASWLRWRHPLGMLPAPDFGEDGVQLLPRLHLPMYNETERCYAHGVFPYSPGRRQPKRFPPRRVYDVALLLDDRVDLLEVRIRELEHTVDTFVVVEAATTLRGEQRQPRYADYASEHLSKADIGKVANRILYTSARAEGSDRSSRLQSLYTAVDTFLGILRIPSDSLVIQSLADDIPSAASIKLIRNCTAWPWPVRLDMRGRDRRPLAFEPYVLPFDTRETQFARPTEDDGPGSILPEGGWHWPGGAPHCSVEGAGGTTILAALPKALVDPPPHLMALASASCDERRDDT